MRIHIHNRIDIQPAAPSAAESYNRLRQSYTGLAGLAELLASQPQGAQVYADDVAATLRSLLFQLEHHIEDLMPH